MRVRHIFFCLIFLEFIVTTTFMLSYHDRLGPVTEFIDNLRSKLMAFANGSLRVLWRRLLHGRPLPTIQEQVEDCMKMANFHSSALIEPAATNADYFFREFRKAIPETPLPGYRSHCWIGNYSVEWGHPKYTCHGELGNVTFSRNFDAFFPYPSLIFPYMNKHYPKQKYKSDLVCLPNVFVAGFPKCGSTFFYYIVDSLIAMSTGDQNKNQVEKETQFWVHFDPFQKIKIGVPKVEDLGGYLFNFIPGLQKLSRNKSLIDGTPTYISEWPIFTQEENNVTNYCLIPVTLPRILPDSKYFVIMRNPISMLYSNFWFSCTKNLVKISSKTRGPDVFHERTMSKITKFNLCMRNESVESISFVCTLLDKEHYASCIKKRLHLLDKCSIHILKELYSPEMPHCGDIWLSVGIFYVHVRKWLNTVPKERIKFMTLEEVNSNVSLVAHGILEFLDLNTTIADDIANMNKVMKSGRTNSNTQNRVNYKKDSSLQMRSDTKQALEIFYHPFNSLLAELLGDDKYLWF